MSSPRYLQLVNASAESFKQASRWTAVVAHLVSPALSGSGTQGQLCQRVDTLLDVCVCVCIEARFVRMRLAIEVTFSFCFCRTFTQALLDRSIDGAHFVVWLAALAILVD